MKAATGELNLTLITIIAIGAIIAFFVGIVLPQMKTKITGELDIPNQEVGYVEVIDVNYV